MARFFIDRPIFAWVIAIIIMLAGGLALFKLPVEMYPDVAPPTITLTAIHPGASARTIEETVTQIIETKLVGIDGLQYFTSQSYSYAGYSNVTLVFHTGTDLDAALVQVQNRVQQAMPALPEQVRMRGVSAAKASSGFLQIVAFVSTDGALDAADVADFVGSSVVDTLSRVPGVGHVREFAGKYALRIWLDPAKLQAYAVSAEDIAQAVRGRTLQPAFGELGGGPAVDGQPISAYIEGEPSARTAEDVGGIVIRASTDGSELRLRDVARVELGAESYEFSNRLNGRPAAGVGITLAPGANALQTRAAVDQALEGLSASLPAGVEVVVPYDATPFVRMSIKGVVQTLIEAIVLVFVVMYLFLQNFRATLIPAIAVPVVLLGTFGVLAMLGFSVNMLTMFAMVLAIGLLVDDAIVVVENVERIMSEEGLSPLEATRKSMGQITGALVGIGLVLSAVFVPMAFMSGSTGVIYRQFSATIVSAMALSVLVAIVLTPALCATMLKPLKKGEHHVAHRGLAGRFFNGFNRGFDRTSESYQRGVRGIIHRPWRFMGMVAALFVLMGVLFVRLPSAFLPNEDQGTLVVLVNGVAGSTLQQTTHALQAVEHYFLESDPMAEAMFTVAGYSYSGMGQNAGLAFIRLKDWARRGSADNAEAIALRATRALATQGMADFHVLAPPPIPALGNASGFGFFLKDDAGQGHSHLAQARDTLLAAASQSPLLQQMRANGMEDVAALQVCIDDAKARAHGLTAERIGNELGAGWGGRYVADFLDRGRVKRIIMQADASSRGLPQDFSQWAVRNDQARMVPFDTLGSTHWIQSSPRLERFNGTAAMEIHGQPAPGTSSGEAMREIERLVALLPPGFSIEWTGAASQERDSRSQLPLLYVLSLLMVFLCLAAMYESWIVPVAVLLAAPLGILGAVLANTVNGLERDIYFQVAMLTTVGLTSKNAILIIEFAKEHMEHGAGLINAIMHAVRDRLRPIVMTSLAFGMGVIPLAVSSGAGSGAKQAIGIGVLGGMVAGTSLGLLFVPLFFVVVQRAFKRG
ncbi:efflux RND transporter permease subunit [Stenotrophomonas maltophilia group sp. Smal32]|uniref:efflux RND transporter permease subunit n=1 Tax=Stenotrophomonas maltophilia group sp. Smal32 TaxID=3377164 RepID=UPI0025523E6D|nr:efflux RND transporter permease subunit [Stenotrophomonas maltophilia]